VGSLLLPVVGCSPGAQFVRAQGSVDVTSYSAALKLAPETRRLEGRVQARVHHPDTTETLRFYLTGLTVETVWVDGAVVEYSRQGEVLSVPRSAGDTVSTVEMAYHGVPGQGLYARSHDGQSVIFTDSWPARARGWLPSVDIPSDPATFELTLDVPLGYETVANGRETARDTTGHRVRTTWKLSASAPTYSMAFAVSDFAPTCTNGGDGLSICYYMLAPDSSRAGELRRTPETLAYFSETFGPYAYENYQVVQIPIQYGGMENAALPFLRAELFHGEGRAESVQVHEAVHQWFGNRVVLARWRDLWLSEGVATYFTTRFYERYEGKEEVRRRWVEMVDIDSKELDRTVLVPDQPVEPGEFLTWIPYRKGASVLHLFRQVMGAEAFDTAMREIYHRFAGRALSTPVFLDRLREHADVPLDSIIEYWVYGGDVPTLDVTWDPTNREVSWKIQGDDRTLDGVPFELQIMEDDTPVYVSAAEGSYRLGGETRESPRVRPVGILMKVNDQER
jgi:aminopeptidase N